MAEAGIAAFGSAIGVAITLAVVTFILRQRRSHGPEMEALLDEQTATPEPVKEEPTPEPVKEEPTPEPVKEEPKTEEK